ncbi:MAG: XkdF-like putative serine protease domain-containing protein [Nitrosomonadaceae bacterium]
MNKSMLKRLKKSIWSLPDSRFFAMCNLFGTTEVFKELGDNNMWCGDVFKAAHPKKKNEDVKKFASNAEMLNVNITENKETWNGKAYDNLPEGEREFITEVNNQLRKAQIVFKEHVGEVDKNKEHYIEYMFKALNKLLNSEPVIKMAGDMFKVDTWVSHYEEVNVNGHRHGQHNGGLTGTDIPLPGMPDFHFHIMEGGHGATWGSYQDAGHTHEEPNGDSTGKSIWPEYSSPVVVNLNKESMQRKIAVAKMDAPRQIVIGALYIPFDENNPETVDTHGHACTKEEIQNSQIEFMRNRHLGNVDLQHNFEKGYGFVVESYIAKDGDPDFIPGTWVVGVKITDDDVWAQVEKGEITGFSLAGSAYLREVA